MSVQFKMPSLTEKATKGTREFVSRVRNPKFKKRGNPFTKLPKSIGKA